jgi:hypothetical protein
MILGLSRVTAGAHWPLLFAFNVVDHLPVIRQLDVRLPVVQAG